MNGANFTEPAVRVNGKSVAVFYVLACALSWPFYWWRDLHPQSWNSWTPFSLPSTSPLTFILKNAVVMWGPGVAALVTLFLFRRTHRRTVTFFGTSVSRSLLFYWVPICIAAMVGMPLLMEQ